MALRAIPGGWGLFCDERPVPEWVRPTKRAAVDAATPVARELGARLVVERADGSVQRTQDFGGAA